MTDDQPHAPPSPEPVDPVSTTPLPAADPDQVGFIPETLDKTVISIPLLRELQQEGRRRETAGKEHPEAPIPPPELRSVIIEVNLEYAQGRDDARRLAAVRVMQAIARAGSGASQGLNGAKFSQQYLFGRLEGPVIQELVRLDNQIEPTVISEKRGAGIVHRSIYRIWPDFPIKALITKSISTVKADAARNTFSASGEDIVWAVLDSGVDASHPHFARHENLTLQEPLRHRDFTAAGTPEQPLRDQFGHGTHVAGIIAGEMGTLNGHTAVAANGAPPPKRILALARHRDEHGQETHQQIVEEYISGMAPRCKIVSMKVLDDAGRGEASNMIAAIEQIQMINGYGRRLLIHGVNMSVGYDFLPEWFACGQSPLCVEVDRLVRSGVVVVVAAGNTGYGWNATAARGSVPSGMDLTINDPGNAEQAITVGATHRDSPHVYGVSYFSSKGPTGDGRLKPDLVAPGEKILSCAAGQRRANVIASAGLADPDQFGLYVEDSGTSMAAPHVSGVIAAFLSERREFIGQTDRVKEIFLDTATDLKRDRNFQGRGLVDLMRAMQHV